MGKNIEVIEKISEGASALEVMNQIGAKSSPHFADAAGYENVSDSLKIGIDSMFMEGDSVKYGITTKDHGAALDALRKDGRSVTYIDNNRDDVDPSECAKVDTGNLQSKRSMDSNYQINKIDLGPEAEKFKETGCVTVSPPAPSS